MRELRGQGVVEVHKVHTDDNPADLFTKVLKAPTFIKHRKTVMNLAADIEQDRATGSSERKSGVVPARSAAAAAFQQYVEEERREVKSVHSDRAAELPTREVYCGWKCDQTSKPSSPAARA